MVKIQQDARSWLVPLLEQGQRNLGTRGHISTIVIERGSLDGQDLWQVDRRGVRFVIVGKANMALTQDAQALAKREPVQVRERLIGHGHGKTARQERLRTELVGIEGLRTSDRSGYREQTQHAHRREDEGQPINAVVGRRWDNRVPAPDGSVYLTTGPVSDPFVSFETYDWRCVIENGLWKRGEAPLALRTLSQEDRSRGGGALPFYLAGYGAQDRLSLVASQACIGSNAATRDECQSEYRVAGGRRHGRLSTAAEARKIALRSSSFSVRPRAFFIWPNWRS